MARKRKNSEGTVRLRKDGRWEGRYVVGCDDNGNPKPKNALAKTKGECVEKMNKLNEFLGGIKSDKIKSGMPFGDWMGYWCENHRKPRESPHRDNNSTEQSKAINEGGNHLVSSLACCHMGNQT